MTVHELKILPEYFDAVRCGDKRFEIRKNDRNFHSGDILRLKEWDGQKYTGEEIDVLVRYILYGIDEYGLSEGYCIMSIDTGFVGRV
jgi:ASC-1-like (ASCH) protein